MLRSIDFLLIESAALDTNRVYEECKKFDGHLHFRLIRRT